MQPVSVLAVLATVAAVGGVLLSVATVIRAAKSRFRSEPFRSGSAEGYALHAAVAAAVLAVLWLNVGPFYSGFAGSGTFSLAGTASLSAGPRSSSFVSTNGAAVLPLVVLPVVVALLPFGFRSRGTRPVAEAVCAVVLAGQAVIGISGYGLLFAPSAVLMLVAAILASSNHAA